MTLSGDHEMYQQLLKSVDNLKTEFAKQGQKYTSLEILSFSVKQFDSKINVHDISETVKCDRNNADEDLLVTTTSAAENLMKTAGTHGSICDKPLALNRTKQNGCLSEYEVRCSACSFSSVWISSPVLPDGRDLVNLRITHGYLSSGLLPSQLDRFLKATTLDTVPTPRMTQNVNQYAKCVEEERTASCTTALQSKCASANENGIDIITDARHSTRRNSKYTDVVCIGYDSHKVIEHVVVRREDDSCSQRHEMYGTKVMYDNFDNQNIKIRRHGHDRNASVNKFVREKRTNTTNQNDTWHVSVSIEKEMKKVSSGAMCREGKTWSSQLSDKIHPVKTHVNYAMRNCEGSANKLKTSLDNIVSHYQNNHENCDTSSRCRTDPNYKPSRIILTSPVAIRLLNETIQKCDVYRNAQNYVHHMDTFFVESFNNTLNMFQDKRLGSFGDIQYRMRSDLAIIHWNENVKQTSNDKSKNTFMYRDNIWNRWMNKVFQPVVWRPF